MAPSRITCAASSRKPGGASFVTGARSAVCHLFFLWNPLWADLVMAAYAIVANLPVHPGATL